MKVLIACEESQAVCLAFRNKGHEAYSNDLIDCSGGHPEWHLKMDALEAIKLMDWDLMIAHPPCTHLTVSGAAWFYKKQKEQKESLDFVKKLMSAPITKICIENPVSIISSKIRKPDQIIQPYHYGDPYQKTTCLWLKNIPKLIPTHMDAPLFGMTLDKGEFITSASGVRMAKWCAELWGKKDRQKLRSKTFQGIANAMAEQWGR